MHIPAEGKIQEASISFNFLESHGSANMSLEHNKDIHCTPDTGNM